MPGWFIPAALRLRSGRGVSNDRWLSGVVREASPQGESHNPANMQQNWFYDFSNYGTYDRLTSDGLTQWHPAFLALGTTLEICAAAYRKFCTKYRPKSKPEKPYYCGNKLLSRLKLSRKPTKKKKPSPGQMKIWDDWLPAMNEVHEVARKFVLANCLNPDIAAVQFPDTS